MIKPALNKIAFLHNLPLEYYPPACNFLDLAGQRSGVVLQAHSTSNRKGREPYTNQSIEIIRTGAQNPKAHPLLRLVVASWWHLHCAMELWRLKPDIILYVEPHSAIATWIYFKVLRGKARLFIHHHEYYEPKDYERPGMRLPWLGSWLEKRDLFRRAEWVSQTNEDRLRLAKRDHPEVADSSWRMLPNYPPAEWGSAKSENQTKRGQTKHELPLRLVYIGAASFEDTHIREIVEWAAQFPESVILHICGYNVAEEVWQWLENKDFANVTYDSSGYSYDQLPEILRGFDIGLVLYKGNTTNFIYNVPNKVFEYLRCGLEVWYPGEMVSMHNFAGSSGATLRELQFKDLSDLEPGHLLSSSSKPVDATEYTAERAFSTLFEQFDMKSRSRPL